MIRLTITRARTTYIPKNQYILTAIPQKSCSQGFHTTAATKICQRISTGILRNIQNRQNRFSHSGKRKKRNPLLNRMKFRFSLSRKNLNRQSLFRSRSLPKRLFCPMRNRTFPSFAPIRCLPRRIKPRPYRNPLRSPCLSRKIKMTLHFPRFQDSQNHRIISANHMAENRMIIIIITTAITAIITVTRMTIT